MNSPDLKLILEAGLLAAGETASIGRLLALFPADRQPSAERLREALAELAADYAERAVELVEVGGGFRIQVRQRYSPWIHRLWEERPGQYSRALLETLALIAYRQPITRGEISDVRGVSVASSIVKTLQERGWVKTVGHRDVPGRPALYGTTAEFLSYFSLKSLGELPDLADPRDLAVIGGELVADGRIDALPAEIGAVAVAPQRSDDSAAAPEPDASDDLVDLETDAGANTNTGANAGEEAEPDAGG